MVQDHEELLVERLLRSCAITPLLKGFFPLKDLVLLYYYDRVSPEHPKETAALLARTHGKNCHAAMRRALLRSWQMPECRLREYMEDDLPDGPPTPDRFAQVICGRMKRENP